MFVSSLPKYTNVFELARSAPHVDCPAFHRLFELSIGHPRCKATPQLAAKYGVAIDNSQAVLRVQNKVTLAQCWFNEDRTKKPQTFTAAAATAAAFDPLAPGGAGACDFCDWRAMTAEDEWGRVEGEHAVSASNLFKYVKPAQGVILFKHHDPLSFSLEQLQDLVDVSHRWFERAAAHQAQQDAQLRLPRRTLHPLLVWNTLPRAGASQYHGHAQVMLSDAHFPALQHEAESVACYDLTHSGSRGYYQDVLAAHDHVGLMLRDGREGDFAFAFASLAPWKDMEVCVHGSSMGSPAFQRLLYTALRALIDELGVGTFNASIHNIRLMPGEGEGEASSAPANGFDAHARSAPAPVVARVVSRGKLGSLASDFGGLEVFGGASIGHTDPYRVAEALRKVHGTLPAL